MAPPFREEPPIASLAFTIQSAQLNLSSSASQTHCFLKKAVTPDSQKHSKLNSISFTGVMEYSRLHNNPPAYRALHEMDHDTVRFSVELGKAPVAARIFARMNDAEFADPLN